MSFTECECASSTQTVCTQVEWYRTEESLTRRSIAFRFGSPVPKSYRKNSIPKNFVIFPNENSMYEHVATLWNTLFRFFQQLEIQLFEF